MMKAALYLAIGLVMTTLECSLFSFLPTELFKPDLGIPFVIYTAFFLNPFAGLVTSIFVGLMQEVLSCTPAGSMLFAKVSIFIITLFMKNKLYIDSRYSFSFACSGAVLVESFLFLTISGDTRGKQGYRKRHVLCRPQCHSHRVSFPSYILSHRIIEREILRQALNEKG